jgi:hypothetical protein
LASVTPEVHIDYDFRVQSTNTDTNSRNRKSLYSRALNTLIDILDIREKQYAELLCVEIDLSFLSTQFEFVYKYEGQLLLFQHMHSLGEYG